MPTKDRRFLTLIILLLVLGPVRTLASGGIAALKDDIVGTLYMLPGILIGISLHEYGHAKAADLWGDPSPRYTGRLTVDPRAHLDVTGFICLLLLHFGWGKPVVVNPDNFKDRKKGLITVGLAGVCMNLIIAFCAGGVLKLLTVAAPRFMAGSVGKIIGEMVLEIVVINIMLMLFNLIPVPPLDGFGIITEIFGLYRTKFYSFVTGYSWFILMGLILLDVPEMLINRPMIYLVNFILTTVFRIEWWYFLL